MNHFSATIQLDGINGMKELITKNPEILEVNMSTLFNKISDVIAARDFNVRKASLKLLENVIQSSTPKKISPFFPLLNAQLMCSMNHIQLDIQKDSHLLLDLLLTTVPQLVSNVAVEVTQSQSYFTLFNLIILCSRSSRRISNDPEMMLTFSSIIDFTKLLGANILPG